MSGPKGDSVNIILHTLHGARPSADDFSKCKWVLPDPITLPRGNSVLTMDVLFASVPASYDRLTAERGTTTLYYTYKSDANDPNAQWESESVVIPDGSYTRTGLAAAFSKALELKGHNYSISIQEDPLYRAVLTHKAAGNNEILHIVPSSQVGYVYTAADVLGFTRVTTPPGSPQPETLADSPFDTQGTRCVTIRAAPFGCQPDPVTLNRRRGVLKVIPSHDGALDTPMVWERTMRQGHTIPGQSLSAIELALEDDLGLPLNPNHHWCVGLEVSVADKNFLSSIL